jgi:cell division protein FtsB
MNVDSRDLQEYIQELRDELSTTQRRLIETLLQIDTLNSDRREAVEELSRWQYCDQIDDTRHSIDVAIRILQRG